MASSYQFWLTDNRGRRIFLLDNFTFFSYIRSNIGYGTVEIGFPYKMLKEKIGIVFGLDRYLDIWRSPDLGIPMRREQVYLLRMPRIFTREDGFQEIVFYGRDPKDLLRRRHVIQAAGTQWTSKNSAADDMMKAIVREQMLYGSCVDVDGVLDNSRAWPLADFEVQGNVGVGPVITHNFADRNVLDVLKDIRDVTAQLSIDNLVDMKIYFDVVPINLSDSRVGFRFETFAGLRGTDRTEGVVFSEANSNLEQPFYSKSHLDEMNTAIVKGFGRGVSREWDTVQDTERATETPWNRCETYVDGSNEPDQSKLADIGRAAIYRGRPNDQLTATFINSPGGDNAPQSLYGVQWDLGDLVPVDFADRRFDVEIDIVYVAMNDKGEETITGRNSLNESVEV